MLATSYGAGQVAFDLLWFFLLFVEVWLMLSVFIDIFRSHDLSGLSKALWVIFVLVIPLIGILCYLIVRGGQMRAHQQQSWQAMQQRYGGYGGATPGRSAHDTVDALHRLTDLRDRGEITADQFRKLRDQLLGEEDASS